MMFEATLATSDPDAVLARTKKFSACVTVPPHAAALGAGAADLCATRIMPGTVLAFFGVFLDDFGVKVRLYERTLGEVLSDLVKIELVQNGIEDEDLRRHLLMHAARLWTISFIHHGLRYLVLAGAHGRQRRLQRD